MLSAVMCMSPSSVWHLCNLPCVYVLLGSFLSQDMPLNLHEFAFEGQNMKFTVNMLLTCILYSVHRARLRLELFASAVGRSRFLSRMSYFVLVYFSLGDYVALRWESYYICLSDRAYASLTRCIGLFLLWLFWHHMIQIKSFALKSVDCFAHYATVQLGSGNLKSFPARALTLNTHKRLWWIC